MRSDGWLTSDGLGRARSRAGRACRIHRGAVLLGLSRVEPRTPARQHGSAITCLFNLFVASMLTVPVMANVALMWIAVELTTLLSAFLVGYENTPEALEAAWKYVVLTTLGAILALLGFLILYWGSRVAGYAPFTWARPGAGSAAHAPGTACGPPSCSYSWVSAPRSVSSRCTPGCPTRTARHRHRSARCCPASRPPRCSTSSCGCFRCSAQAPGLDARPWFIGFGLLSVAVATLLLIYVRDFKRMFAFSTVEHMGIILVAAGLGGADAHLGAAYQLTAHAIAKSFCFFAAGAVVDDSTRRTSPPFADSSDLRRLRRWCWSAADSPSPARRPLRCSSASSSSSRPASPAASTSSSGCWHLCRGRLLRDHVPCDRMAFGLRAGRRLSPHRRYRVRSTLAVAAVPLLAIGIYVPETCKTFSARHDRHGWLRQAMTIQSCDSRARRSIDGHRRSY